MLPNLYTTLLKRCPLPHLSREGSYIWAQLVLEYARTQIRSTSFDLLSK